MTTTPERSAAEDTPTTERQLPATRVAAAVSAVEQLDELGVGADQLPLRTRYSGLYRRRRPAMSPAELDELDAGLPGDEDDGLAPDPGGATGAAGAAGAADAGEAAPGPPLLITSEALRLDVDGHYPQMTASGTIHRGSSSRVHWIASIARTGPRAWRGTIWYKEGDVASLPHTEVRIVVFPRPASVRQRARVVFRGGAPRRVATYRYASPYYHPVELEFDATADSLPVASIKTCDHPNRPPTLPCEDLTIEDVYRRSGFHVRSSTGSGDLVPLTIASQNADPRWDDNEMHDAMQAYWSRFDHAARWAMWVFWARQHEWGSGLGGIMFDDIGPNHRQGTAIFTDSFIATPPAGDPNPAAWVERMKFWTAVHEIGHGFNLAHSWQKEHPPEWGNPWIPLLNDLEARSFMNYPYNVAGGEPAFFGDFEFRFIDPELLFMRHAPEAFVRMGDADWFVDHGFEAPPEDVPTDLRLTVRANRPTPTFDFLEPVVLELKLTNTAQRPVTVDRRALASDQVVVVLQRRGRPARQWMPYARHCREPEPTVLAPGESLYESLPVYAGRNGWDISEPGTYRVQVGLDAGPQEQPIVSGPLIVKVRAPATREEERLAPDLFSDEAGRALALGGTVVMDSANDALEAVVERAPDSRAALHAQATLAAPLTVAYKVLDVPEDADGQATSAGQAGAEVRTLDPRPDEAAERLRSALIAPSTTAAETFGHVDYRRRVDRLGRFLDRQGDPAAAAQTERSLRETLAARGVLPGVIEEIGEREQAYASRARAKRSK